MNNQRTWGGMRRPIFIVVCLGLGAALGCNSCGSSTPEAETPPAVTAEPAPTSTAPADPTGGDRASGGCVIGGCSSTVCQDPAAATEQQFTTCEYQRHFECYETATCGRDANNQCNWEMTPLLEKCLKRHGAL